MPPLLRGSFWLCLLALLPGPGAPMPSEIVTPIRLDPDLNGRQYFQRGAEEPPQPGAIFQIAAFQEDFYLNLSPDARFLAPAFATRYLGAPRRAEPGDWRRCFYSGDVNSDRDSFAALSLCGGLTGAFGYRGAEYLISPVRNASGTRAGRPLRNSQGAHLLQRRSAPRHAAATSRCGVESASHPALAQALERYKGSGPGGGGGGGAKPAQNETAGRGLPASARKSGRAKRFVSIPRYVETLVVADESMVKFHGDDLQHYLLTLMATAARLYRHPSIQNPISLAVVKFLVIGQDDKGPKVTNNAALTLRNFCVWQKKWNKGSDKHPEYWDTAILFTKQVGGRRGGVWSGAGGTGRPGKGAAAPLRSPLLWSGAPDPSPVWGPPCLPFWVLLLLSSLESCVALQAGRGKR
ncbi:A disintegrin and metalloproteinase with thrombospondin motifs 15 [Crotalus adamanteus]|uniref:A disintegrin and metalloproteinase with thrombospondin motifs 15 n=1 Tax=Crotalus adamanteus TaxID=8729 RepID=A0AAW1AYP5_CROAD